MTEESRTAATKRILALLAGRWPALFDAERPVPLAVGVCEALAALTPDATVDQVRRALAFWCSRSRYLSTLAAGAERHGLEGVQGVVADGHAADAAAVLAARRAAHRERNKARREAERAMGEQARLKAERIKAREEAEAKKAGLAAALPAPAERSPVAAKPAGPVVVVRKRRFAPPVAGS